MTTTYSLTHERYFGNSKGHYAQDLFLKPMPRYHNYGLTISELRNDAHGRYGCRFIKKQQRNAFIDPRLGGLLPCNKTDPTMDVLIIPINWRR